MSEAITRTKQDTLTKEARPLNLRRSTGSNAERAAFVKFGDAADELLGVGLAGLSQSQRERVAQAMDRGATLRASVDFGAKSFGVYLVAEGAQPIFLFGARHEFPRVAVN